ncbi:MAG: hypothetical protein ACKOQ4_06705 [Mycobacterium sp.]
MLIVALILAVIGLAALVTAVVTNNELIAWVCIGASGLGVLLLVFDAIRERSQRRSVTPVAAAELTEVIEPLEPAESTDVIQPVADGVEPDDALAEELAAEDYPEELVHDEPDYDMPSDDEPEFPEPAEEAALHVVDETDVDDGLDDDVGDDAGEPTAEGHQDEHVTVVSYVEEPQGAETEYRYVVSSEAGYTYVESDSVDIESDSGAADSDVAEDRRDQ